jgi:hypothetical protein
MALYVCTKVGQLPPTFLCLLKVNIIVHTIFNQTLATKKTPPEWGYQFLILFKIHPSLTTSKEGLKTINVHLETTSIQLF